MERLITFCVLLFHFGLNAALPFPEGYNLAYQQPFQYSNFAQPVAQQNQAQHYGNIATYPNSYIQYQSAPAQRQGYGTNYMYTIGEPPVVPNVSNQEQSVQETNEQQVYNEQLANQIRYQNTQQQQTVSEPYQQVNGYGSLFYPAEQQLPSINSQAQWVPEDRQYVTVNPAEAASGPQQSLEANKQTLNPFQQIYQHFASGQPNPQNPIQWQNLWKQYSAPTAPKRERKRYLVIHPDGRTEYVDRLDSIAKKHPNYVLVNAGSLPANVDPSNLISSLQSNPASQNIYPPPQTQQLEPPAPAVTSNTEIQQTNSSLNSTSSVTTAPLTTERPSAQSQPTQLNPTPTAAQTQPLPTQPIPTAPTTQTPPDPLPTTEPTPPGTAGSPTANPTPNSPIEPLTPAPTKPTITGAPTPSSGKPKPDDPTVTTKPVTPAGTPTPAVPKGTPVTATAKTNDTTKPPTTNTPPGLPKPDTTPKTPKPTTSAPSTTPVTTSKPSATTQPTPTTKPTPTTESTPKSKPAPTNSPPPTTTTNSPKTTTSPGTPAPTDKAPAPSKPSAPAGNPTTVKPDVPANKDVSKKPESKGDVKPESASKPSSDAATANSNKKIPKRHDEEAYIESIALAKSTDSDILSRLVGDDEPYKVVFITVRAPPIVEKDVRTTVYPDGSKVIETIETIHDDDDEEPTVKRTVRVLAAGEEE